MTKLLFLVVVAMIPILLLLSPMEVSAHTDKLLKQIIKEQKLQIDLQQDNANVSTTRLNTMLLYMQNMLAHLEIISANQMKGH